MTTESHHPTLTLQLQYAPRGDVRWRIVEGAEPFSPGYPGDWGGWADPDDVWREVRQDLPVAIATWNHRIRRQRQAEEDAYESMHGIHRRHDEYG